MNNLDKARKKNKEHCETFKKDCPEFNIFNHPKNNHQNKYSGFDALTCDGDSKSLKALKIAYRKHVLSDDSIGWDELTDILGDALSQIMGDSEFLDWLNEIKD